MNRVKYLDIAKGIGIILVILGHMDIGFVKNYIYSFHLPLFFLISGICFNLGENYLSYLKKKSYRCLLPYAVFGMIIVLVETKTGYLYKKGFKINLIDLLKQERYSTLWFLATLFLASNIFYLIVKICKQNEIIILIVSIVLSVIFVYLDQNLIRALPWNLDTAFIVLGFMAVGYFIKNFKGILDKLVGISLKKKIVITVLFFLGNVACFILNLMVSEVCLEMYWNCYGNYALMILSAIFGCLMIILISSMIDFAPLERLGKNSMTYFALHQSVFLWPYTLLFRKIKFLPIKVYARTVNAKVVLAEICLFVLTLVSCMIVDKIIRRTKLKIILGEK